MEVGSQQEVMEVFPKAPITEGLIDIRVQLPGNVSLADLEQLHTKIKGKYPDKKTRRMWHGTIELKNGEEPQRTSHVQDQGYLFSTSDGKRVLQYRLDGFTFSRLRPYTRWEEVYSEAQKLWEIYRLATKPVSVTRLALRYINSIEIPSCNSISPVETRKDLTWMITSQQPRKFRKGFRKPLEPFLPG